MEEYLKDFNATRAYKVVHGNKMQERSAGVLACETLKNIKVMAEIDRRITGIFERLNGEDVDVIVVNTNHHLCQ